jgi:rhamnulokinase
MKTSSHLAIDLGAESGRVMLGTLLDGTLKLQELHRFANQPVGVAESIRWDLLGMFREIREGLRKGGQSGAKVESLSVDSWGVDYVWSGAGQPMLSPPYIYRDIRVDAAYQRVLAKVSKESIFAETGIQFMAINTLYQLFDDHQRSPGLVALADRFLPIADHLHYWLSGEAKAEISLASTTQIFHPLKRRWSEELIRALGFRREVFPDLVEPATRLGTLLPELGKESGLGGVEVIATCSHDTGAAVAAVPAGQGDDWAFLSSGTWSLMGVELPAPLLDSAAMEANFTNEQGFAGTTRFLKNIVGLWILQECRRTWEKEGQSFDYETITRLAADAPAFVSLIDPDDARFLKPGEMPEKIVSFCRETKQPVPGNVGAFARCILESLALLYGVTLAQLEALSGRTIKTLHVVGGGSRSSLLNQFTAGATGRRVLAGPVEATAMGNILLQAAAQGILASPDDLRVVVRRSCEIAEYLPRAREASLWQKAVERFAALRAG